MAPHSSTLAWKIPWTEEPGRLQSMGSLSRTWLNDFTFTFHFHALEKEMATHSSVLAWRIPGLGEPGGLPSMGSHRVGHDWSDFAAAAAPASIKLRSHKSTAKLSTLPFAGYWCRKYWVRSWFIVCTAKSKARTFKTRCSILRTCFLIQVSSVMYTKSATSGGLYLQTLRLTA